VDLEAKENALSGITAVILAGGKGSRVGHNKAFIKLGHTYLLELVLQNMSKIFDDIIIVTSRCDHDRILSIHSSHSSMQSCYRINVICDSDAGQGPLLGLLEALKVTKEEWLFLAGCDMPFINRSLVKHIYSLKNGNSQAVVPRFKGFLEPLHAFYHRSCLKEAEIIYGQGKRKIKDFYPFVNLSVSEESDMNAVKNYHRSFFNINDLYDLARAEKMLLPYPHGGLEEIFVNESDLRNLRLPETPLS